MRGAALLTILTSNAYVLDLELDGTYAPLRFAICAGATSDSAIARAGVGALRVA